jgi:hypothetical protein
MKPKDTDWTVDPISHRYNSSPLFKHLEKEVTKIIHNSARDLISGRAEHVAGLILAQLTHKFGLVPSKSLGEILEQDKDAYE